MDDDALIDALRQAALRHDPVPASALRVAMGALAWRSVDAELAELLADSAVDADALAGVRSVGLPRLLVFQTDDLELEVELEDDDDGRRAVGQIAPAGFATISVEQVDGIATTGTADELGRFALVVPAWPFRLRIERPGFPPVVTPVIA